MSSRQVRKYTLIDSHKSLLHCLNRLNNTDTEQQRSNMPTHSGNALDAHRLSIRGLKLLELRRDTAGFPTPTGRTPAQDSQDTGPGQPGPVQLGQGRVQLGRARPGPGTAWPGQVHLPTQVPPTLPTQVPTPHTQVPTCT